MSREIQLRAHDNLPDLADPLATYGQQEQQPANILHTIHRLLHGRYHWCILLSLIGAALGGTLGYRLVKPIYISTGLIQVKPVLPRIISATPENEPMPMFDSFLQSQVALITNQRVIDMALASDELRSFGHFYSEEEMAEFKEKLAVKTLRGTQIISVSFESPDPKMASTAVKAVIRAYDRIYVEREIQLEAEKRQTLERRRNELNGILRNVRDRIHQAAGEYVNEENLRSLLHVKIEYLNRLQSTLDELAVELAKSGQQSQQAQPDAPSPEPAQATLVPSVIALRDAGMRQLLREQQALNTELELRLRSLGENHPKIIELRTLIAAKERAITQYADDYNAALALNVMPGSVADLTGVAPEELRRRQQRYQELFENTQAQINAIAGRITEIERLHREENQALADLAVVERRLDQLDIEPSSQGRIQIADHGERATILKDKRKQAAAAGTMAGGGLGCALILMIGLLDRRFRSLDDARSGMGRLSLLGILPSLPEDLSDPEQAAIASHCVHQVRTLLQIGTDTESRVFAITSPAAGSGKTSLTLALGISFAAANSRTLLIDCDIVGGGLTARVEAIIRRKIGQILRREGLITQQQLDTALKVANSSQRRLGEVLVELGYLRQADIARALTIQQEIPVGMLDALAGENIEDCVAETGIRGLAILPLGAAMPNDVGRLSPGAIRKLIDRARQCYDTIIVDTGPVPGSLEASTVAAAADGVVLVVSRGDHRPLAERSVQHLYEIGARIAGMVFNRADARDMHLSTTSSRLSSSERGAQRASVRRTDLMTSGDSSRLGPIAQAVTGQRQADAESDQR